MMTTKLITTRNLIALTLAIVLATLALILTLWLNRSPGPSPFFAGAAHSGDPLGEVLERVMSQLSRTHSDIKIVGSGGGRGCSSRENYEERTQRISMSPAAAKVMMPSLQVWCEFAAARAGARVQQDHCEYGENKSVFSFRYEYPRIKGFVKVTMTPPETSAEDLKKRQSSGGSIDLMPYLYKLHWEVRESPSA
jgi:hypothetical protein